MNEWIGLVNDLNSNWLKSIVKFLVYTWLGGGAQINTAAPASGIASGSVDEDKATWLVSKKPQATCVCASRWNFPLGTTFAVLPNPSHSLCPMNEGLDLYWTKRNPSLCAHPPLSSFLSTAPLVARHPAPTLFDLTRVTNTTGIVSPSLRSLSWTAKTRWDGNSSPSLNALHTPIYHSPLVQKISERRALSYRPVYPQHVVQHLHMIHTQ